MTTQNITELVTAWGAGYKAGKVKKADLIAQLFKKDWTLQYINVLPTDSTIIDKAFIRQSPVLQRFQAVWSALGAMSVEPDSWSLDAVKVNVPVTPDEIRGTAIQFLANHENLNRKDWPWVAMQIEHIITQIAADRENLIFDGVPGSITSGTAQVNSIRGFGTRLKAYHTAGKTNVLAMGAVPTDAVELVEYVEDAYKMLPIEARPFIDDIKMNYALMELYREGFNLKYNANYRQDVNELSIRNTMAKVVGLPSMKTSSLMIFSTKGNLVGYRYGLKSDTVFNVREHDEYNVRISSDWYEGYGWLAPQLIWHTDQGLS